MEKSLLQYVLVARLGPISLVTSPNGLPPYFPTVNKEI
jgi:hypothetical protein